MKWLINFTAKVIIILGLVMLVPITILAAVYDDFNETSLDTTLWKVFDSANVLSLESGYLKSSGPPSQQYGNIESIRSFHGDFEFFFNYNGFHTTADLFAGNCPQVWLQVMDSDGNFIFIFRGLCQNGHTFFSNADLMGQWTQGVDAPASLSSGSLKITRTGASIYTYYKEGDSNTWIQLGAYLNVFTGEVKVQVASYTGDNGTFQVYVDSLVYNSAATKPEVPTINFLPSVYFLLH